MTSPALVACGVCRRGHAGFARTGAKASAVRSLGVAARVTATVASVADTESGTCAVTST